MNLDRVLNRVIMLVWVIDILNIGININGFNIAYFLDTTLPINFLGWFLIFWVLEM